MSHIKPYHDQQTTNPQSALIPTPSNTQIMQHSAKKQRHRHTLVPTAGNYAPGKLSDRQACYECLFKHSRATNQRAWGKRVLRVNLNVLQSIKKFPASYTTNCRVYQNTRRTQYSDQSPDWITREPGFNSRQMQRFLSFPMRPDQLRKPSHLVTNVYRVNFPSH